jgi:dienelactone hydrolase
LKTGADHNRFMTEASRIKFDPLLDESLVDQTLAIRIRGLGAGERVNIRLCSAGYADSVLLSHALFVADANGVVDLARQAPVEGSYEGVDAMGLFWSRAPIRAAAAPHDAAAHEDPLTVTLSAVAEDGSAAVARHIKRTFASAEVVSQGVRERGLVGRMFEPAGHGPHPAVLVVGGSNGGLAWSQEMAALLASHGFAALALAYFGAEGLPPTLDRIPLEYFETALDWLAARPSVAGARIAVTGLSRGGELALLLGATYARISAIVAWVPSGIVGPAFPTSGRGAWTLGGQEIPFASTLSYEEWDKALASGLAREGSFDWFLLPLQDAEYAAKATIPVERIQGPVLMVSGQEDGMWPSTELTAFAIRRFEQMGFAHQVEHLSYPGAGHSIIWPNAPTTMLKSKHSVSGEDVDMGGTPEGTARARQDAWPRVLAFLKNALDGG